LLINSDHGGEGIWLIQTEEDLNAPLPPGGAWVPAEQLTGPSPWALGLVGEEILSALRQWNDDSSNARLRSIIEGTDISDDASESLYARQLQLAKRVQEHLGDEWEVLYSTGAAWHWVQRPRAWGPATA
jgi:hypothetical protein